MITRREIARAIIDRLAPMAGVVVGCATHGTLIVNDASGEILRRGISLLTLDIDVPPLPKIMDGVNTKPASHRTSVTVWVDPA